MITELTDLEARGASNLHEVYRDLQIWRNHLEIYDQVVERAAFLWDGVSTHLVTRSRALRRVHKTVELLHQVLLQGIGDLAHLSNRTRDCVAHVEKAADQLRTAYDDQLTERHGGQSNGLRGALARIGLFERAVQDGHQTLEEANRVKAIYDDLLRSIGYAFDEWRVRDADVVQRLSAGLGRVLALFGIVAILDATFDLKPVPTTTNVTIFGWGGPVQTVAVLTSWAIGAFLLVTLATQSRARVRSGRLGSRYFRREYSGRRLMSRHRGLWRLLKDISTDGLTRLKQQYRDNKSELARSDAELAARFAAFWDRASAMDSTHRRNRLSRDISAQSRRIEQWGLHSLLLTERARRMHEHILPVLTCLYRACTRLPGSPISAGQSPQNVRTMIDFNEFALCLKPLGFSWDDAYQLELWLLHRRPRTARHLLAILANEGLGANMTPEQAKQMIKRMMCELDRTELSDYPQAFAEDIRRYMMSAGFTGWDGGEGGEVVKATARHGGREHVLHAWTETTPTMRGLGALLRERRGRKALLLATGVVRPHIAVAARLVGIRTRSLRWSS